MAVDFLFNHILTLIISLPLAGAAFAFFLPRKEDFLIKLTAGVFSFLSFFTSLIVFMLYYLQKLSGYQFIEKIDWIRALGISYHLGVDGISVILVFLTGILTLTSVLVSWNINHRTGQYFALMFLSLAGVFGLFMCIDLFFFILFYELASIPMYFLIGIWGSDFKSARGLITKESSAVKLILYLQLGGGLILLGIIGAYFASGIKTFDINLLASAKILYIYQLVFFPLIFIGFGIEGGLFPFHTWLPNGHSAAPTALSMILAGVLLKMGGYGMLRAIQLFPEGAVFWMKFFAVLAVIGILYGAMCALAQRDIKYIIAYSSISHMGIVVLGLATFNVLGYNGAVYQMFSHGVITALLFALAGFIYQKAHTRDINEMGGLAKKIPYLATFFMLGALGAVGLPGMSGFVAELLVFIGAFKVYPVLAVLSILCLVITALYILRTAQLIFFGPLDAKYEQIQDANGIESLPLAILSFAVIFFGVLPSLLNQVMTIDIVNILSKILFF